MAAPATVPLPTDSTRWSRSVGAFVLLVAAVLAYRLFRLVDLYAVDLLFYDQIELYEAFLDAPSLWDLFRWQHGPHRQGLPFLGTRLIAALSDWNVRADAFSVYAWILAATALALALRRRLFGPFSPTDVAIPFLLLTPAEYGIFTHASNASHCAGPIALLFLFCHLVAIRDARARYAALAALDFFLVHTGFAIFAGALTPILLAAFAWRDRREGRPKEASFALACALLSLAWIGVFLIGYTRRNGLDAVVQSPGLGRYAAYVAYMFSNVLGLKALGSTTIAVGAVVALAASSVAVRAFRGMLRAKEDALPREAVVFVLTAFTLLYCAATAVGRIQFGISGAQSSRYVPLVAPAFLGLYLASRAIPRAGARFAVGALFVVALVRASFPMQPTEERFMQQLAQKKRNWVAAYRETGDVAAASRAARLRIDPFRDPRRSTDDTFAYLRKEKLSFFAER